MTYKVLKVENNLIDVLFSDGSLHRFPIREDEEGNFLRDDFIAYCTQLEEQINANQPSEAAITSAKELVQEDEPPALEPDCEKCARVRRRQFLLGTDFTLQPDSPLTDEQKDLAIQLRQELRDVPLQAGFPENVEWPDIRWIIGDDNFDSIINMRLKCSE